MPLYKDEVRLRQVKWKGYFRPDFPLDRRKVLNNFLTSLGQGFDLESPMFWLNILQVALASFFFSFHILIFLRL